MIFNFCEIYLLIYFKYRCNSGYYLSNKYFTIQTVHLTDSVYFIYRFT